MEKSITLNNSSIYKNLYYTSYQGGVYLEKFIYGKYHRNKKLELLKTLQFHLGQKNYTH